MDWSIVITILGIVMGGGGLLFYKERRKGEQLKNEASAAAEWQKLYERADQDRRELDAKIDKLYVELSHFRDENNHLTTDNAILKLQKCEVNGCCRKLTTHYAILIIGCQRCQALGLLRLCFCAVDLI